MPAALVVSPTFEARTLKEFVALSKRKPDSLTFSTASSNGYYVIESFNRAAGLQNRQIPYKGSVPSVLAVVSGEVSFTMDTILNVLQLVEGGKLRMLAVTTKQRMPDKPDMPTLGEVTPGFEFNGWIIMLAPSGVPADVINKLNQQILKVVAMPDVKSKIEALGGTTMLLSPDGLGAMLKSDIARMSEVFKLSDFSQKN